MKIDPGTAVAIGAVVALLGWLYNGRVARVAGRRARTYAIVDDNQKNEELKKSFDVVSKLYRAHVPISNEPALLEFKSHFEKVLNHYEYISAAIICGDVDEALMIRCERSRFIMLNEIFEVYMKEARVEQPTFCENLTLIALRWQTELDEMPLLKRFHEWLVQHPVIKVETPTNMQHIEQPASNRAAMHSGMPIGDG